MRTLGIYSQQFLYITFSNVNWFIMLYTTSLLLIFIINGILYLLTAFIQCLLPPPPLVTTHVFLYEFVCFFLVYNIVIGISIASKKIMMISLSTIYRLKGIILLLTAFPALYIPLLLLFRHFDGAQQARISCPSLSPRVCSNSCSLSWWCHPTMSSSVTSSPLALNLSQHQGLFQWVSFSHQVAKVLELKLKDQSLQWIFRTDFL